MRYNIEMINDQGGFASSAIAETVEGNVISTVPRFDGENDLAIIEFPDENEQYMDELLDGDDNVIAYR